MKPMKPMKPLKARQAGPRTLISPRQLNTPRGRLIYWTVLIFVLVLFTAVFVFPLYWMVTGAMKSSGELARTPPTLFPRDPDPGVYKDAWDRLDLGRFLLNTLWYAAGAWALQMAVCVPAAYALSKLRPLLGRAVLGMMLATLMVPPTVLLVPMYLTVRDVPILHVNWLNTPMAIWFPAAANAFSVFLLKRFFDSIPTELLEAAQLDGASSVRVLWSVIMPVSRPILAVVSIFAVVGVWKDFIWPLLVLPDTDKMTVAVAISSLSKQTPDNILLAALVISSIPAIVLFFLFQRHIMAGLTAGGLKG
ncbi:carbohydrate ABC transporter permease [Actinomadura fulvescens]|uniref:Carbohydrate ABC transporter permease n=1 Tax=Actinomadura fulvescens TaxID=46160 RepID=A0ABN3PS38_9ACTN